MTTAELVKSYFEATASNSAETWANCFADDATVDDPVGGEIINEKAALLERGKQFVEAFETVGLSSTFVSVHENRAAAKWIGRGVTKDGKQAEFEGINLFEFDENGKIKSLQGFWNPSEMVFK